MKITLSEETVETLVQGCREGLVTMGLRLRVAEDRYEKNNIQGMIRRTEEAIQRIEGLTVGIEIEEMQKAQAMSEQAEQRRLIEDIGDISESKMNWIEGRR
jgi:hypothetical protein